MNDLFNLYLETINSTCCRITEGDHWPEDYVKKAKNVYLNQSIYPYLKRLKQPEDVIDILLSELKTKYEKLHLNRTSATLSTFKPIFYLYLQHLSGTTLVKDDTFIDEVLDKLVTIVQADMLTPEVRKNIFNSIHFSIEAFDNVHMKAMDSLENSGTPDSNKLNPDIVNTTAKEAGYSVVVIRSYEELEYMYGGETGAKKRGKGWCHTEYGEVYDIWCDGGKNQFVILEKKNFTKISPDEKSQNAYDEYGLSLIALLVDTKTKELKHCTGRYNHVVNPKHNSMKVDYLFKTYEELSNVVKFNVKKEIDRNM